MPQPEPFAPDLFNTAAYARLHAHRYGDAMRRNHPGGGVFQAARVAPGHYASPGRAPHGGFDAPEELSDDDLAAFVRETESALRLLGARVVGLTMPPFCHAPRTGPRRLATLCRLGWRVTRQELNQAIPVTAGVPEGARHATRKRIAKAVRAGVVVRLLPPAEHRAGYDAIADNRRKKGRMLSMSWDEIQAMQATFPGQVHLFGAEQAGQVIAAAIAMAVNPRVLSVYAWGERAGAEAVTPVSLLAQALYGFARQHGFALLDLGTSSVQGVVDPGLLAFKASLGATPSLKLWLERTLA